jgi:hypothetical protein
MFVVTGTVVFSFLGAFWAIVSIANWQGAPLWGYSLVAVPVIALNALAVTRLISSRSLPRAADPAAARRDGKRMGIAFGIIFTVEAGLIAMVALWLDNAGRSLLIPVAVAFVVGAHFLPLARVFRLPFYYVTGLLCIACALSVLLIPVESMRLVILGLSFAAVLWISALVVLLRHTGRSGA